MGCEALWDSSQCWVWGRNEGGDIHPGHRVRHLLPIPLRCAARSPKREQEASVSLGAAAAGPCRQLVGEGESSRPGSECGAQPEGPGSLSAPLDTESGSRGGGPWAPGLLGSSSPLTAGPSALWLVLWFHLFFSEMRP